MVAIQTGARPHEKRGRATLTARNPLVETTLATGDFQLHHVAAATRFYNAMIRDRNEWSIKNYRGGLFSGRRLKKVDADAALKRALEALEGGAE